jgi:hypothetical protein
MLPPKHWGPGTVLHGLHSASTATVGQLMRILNRVHHLDVRNHQPSPLHSD